MRVKKIRHFLLICVESGDGAHQCYSSSQNHFSISFYTVFEFFSVLVSIKFLKKNHFSSISVPDLPVFTSFQLQFFIDAKFISYSKFSFFRTLRAQENQGKEIQDLSELYFRRRNRVKCIHGSWVTGSTPSPSTIMYQCWASCSHTYACVTKQYRVTRFWFDI